MSRQAMDAIISLEISLSLMTLGSILVTSGLILLYLSIRHFSTVSLPPVSYSVDVKAARLFDDNDERLNSLVSYQVPNGEQHVSIDWKEKDNREVTVSLAEATEFRFGMKQRVYGESTGAEGHLEADLSKGRYLMAFQASDNTTRHVDFTTQATEHRMRFKEYQPIALAMLTIGTVLFVNGLGTYVK
jgi:hypothetical protein